MSTTRPGIRLVTAALPTGDRFDLADDHERLLDRAQLGFLDLEREIGLRLGGDSDRSGRDLSLFPGRVSMAFVRDGSARPTNGD